MGLTVSASRINKQRYWLTFLLDDLVEGSGFEPGALHVTLITWFVTDLGEEQVVNSFRKYFKDLKKVELKVNKEVNFGPNRDVPVNLLDENDQLRDMHVRALAWFRSINAWWAVRYSYAGEEFKPHIRRRGNSYFKEGDVITPDSLSLVRANRQEDGIRIVAAKAELK